MEQSYPYDIPYIPGAKNLAADTLTRPAEFRQECCHISQCRLMQLVVQNSTEWLREVTAETEDNSWRKDMVHILLSKIAKNTHRRRPLQLQYERHRPVANIAP
jgi:predicted secreted protein